VVLFVLATLAPGVNVDTFGPNVVPAGVRRVMIEPGDLRVIGRENRFHVLEINQEANDVAGLTVEPYPDDTITSG
jgi:hypothetical protein